MVPLITTDAGLAFGIKLNGEPESAVSAPLAEFMVKTERPKPFAA